VGLSALCTVVSVCKAINKTIIVAAALGLFAISSAHTARASDVIQATVIYAGTYGNGDVFVELSASINEAGCVQSRFDVPASSPVAQHVLATAYSALVAGKTIKVVTNGCYNICPTLDNSRNSYFFMTN
jgi:hypothetical protein